MSANQLIPELRTIGELFEDGDTIYTVPVYQRNYAWRAEQIEQLISDIQDAIVGRESGYFLGNLIVTKRSSVSDFEVIDGQQRLTTLYLLLTFLEQDGESAYIAHRGRLRYESRPRATEALRHIAMELSQQPAPSPDAISNEDAGIHEGFNIIRQFIRQHKELCHDDRRGQFADFLRTKVTVVRASLPSKTDLNRYFEIMNTRGQQLQQVDIVKARLMSHLYTEAEQACFAWIWDACSDMDSYVQMSLTPKRLDRREAIFGENWTWLKVTDFEKLKEIGCSTDSGSSGGIVSSASISIDDALSKYAQAAEPATGEDEGNERFRSTIEFPAFLLHVLKVVNSDDDEHEGLLDDKQLIKLFDKAVDSDGDKARWVRNFAVALLKYRNLFDGFILKRQYTANSGDDGDWSLQRLLKRVSKRRSMPGYTNTFSQGGEESEEDLPIDSATGDILLLQSMLRVTYTSPRTMHWITKILRFMSENDPSKVSSREIIGLLRGFARTKVKEAFFFAPGGEPIGFGISRIVFTYLDYLLVKKQPRQEFRFAFRNSIEHFYPQHPDKEQSGEKVSSGNLSLLGNLALVSVSANSKFSNSLPKAKAVNFKATIEVQSPKLQAMAKITNEEGWGDAQVQRHHEDMVKLLRLDVDR